MAPASEDLVIYTFKFSPYVQRVLVALKEKDIPYKQISVDFFNKPKELLEANPQWRKVPTITHGGESVAESMVVLQYLEDAFPEKVALMPEDAPARSKVRFWADYVFKGTDLIKDGLLSSPGSPEKKAGVDYVPKFFKTLEGAMIEYSADGPFFTGEKFGTVDVVLAPLISWLQVMEVTLVPIPGPEELPRFHKWLQATAARKSVSDSVPSNEENVQFVSTIITKVAAASGRSH